MSIKERFEGVGFTPEEKLDLTARLERAAEQEDNMTSATKRKIKRISGGMVFGVAAAVMMTAGALAAVLNPGLRGWFDTQTPGGQEMLENSIYRLDRSETYNGWTVSLGECVGDDSSVYIWVDLTAPKGTVLVPPENGFISLGGGVMDKTGSKPEDRAGIMTASHKLEDLDPADNRISALLEVTSDNGLRGRTVEISIDPIVDEWTTTDPETGESVWHTEGTELTAAVRDHEWVFEDITLDYPDQTIRLEPNVEVPWLDGTTTVTRLEISPLNAYMTLEGGSCEEYVACVPRGSGSQITVGGITITSGSSDHNWDDERQDFERAREMEESLTVELALRDGSRVVSQISSGVREHDYREGAEGPKTPYASFSGGYSTERAYSVLDPAQVDHVTVCGVDIPLTSREDGGSAAPEQTAKPSAMEGVVSAKKGLNVRSGPGTRFQVLTAVPKGTRLDILGEESGFYQVGLSGGGIGYASKNHISVE